MHDQLAARAVGRGEIAVGRQTQVQAVDQLLRHKGADRRLIGHRAIVALGAHPGVAARREQRASGVFEVKRPVVAGRRRGRGGGHRRSRVTEGADGGSGHHTGLHLAQLTQAEGGTVRVDDDQAAGAIGARDIGKARETQLQLLDQLGSNRHVRFGAGIADRVVRRGDISPGFCGDEYLPVLTHGNRIGGSQREHLDARRLLRHMAGNLELQAQAGGRAHQQRGVIDAADAGDVAGRQTGAVERRGQPGSDDCRRRPGVRNREAGAGDQGASGVADINRPHLTGHRRAGQRAGGTGHGRDTVQANLEIST